MVHMYRNPVKRQQQIQQQIPTLFRGSSYERWSIKMKTFLKSEGLWEYVEASDDKVGQMDRSLDAKALFFIQQAVDESFFSRIADATSAKQAWLLLKNIHYGSNEVITSTAFVGVTESAEFQGQLTVLEAESKEKNKEVESLKESIDKSKSQNKRPSPPTIYMVPSFVRDHNEISFKPRIVSIGPLHRKDENLLASEGEKATHVRILLSRLEEKGHKQEELLHASFMKVNASIKKIRSCYADEINYSDSELAKMMVMDGCFILEFLYHPKNIKTVKESKFGNVLRNDFAAYDLLLLENQIPFCVLEDIYDCTIAKVDQDTSLTEIIHEFLKDIHPFKNHNFKNNISSSITKPCHILDIMHRYYHTKKDPCKYPSSRRFPSAVELDRAGVNFKPVMDTDWPLVMDVETRRFSSSYLPWGRPTLIMPKLTIDDFTGLILRNLIAYEQVCNDVDEYVASYVVALGMLIDTEHDIAAMVESKVVCVLIDSNQEAANMINNICKTVFKRKTFYIDQLKKLDDHYNESCARHVAWLKRTYFNNPWNVVALLGAIILFVLTVVQTIFTVMPSGEGSSMSRKLGN